MPSNFNDLLELPALMNKVLAELASMREEVTYLRESLPPNLLTIKEAAKRLGVCEKTVRNRIKKGELATVGTGRSTRVDLSRKPVRSVNAEDGQRAARSLQ